MGQNGSVSEKRPALKEIFNAAKVLEISHRVGRLAPSFDQQAFVADCMHGLAELSLTERLRRITESLHRTLPEDYPAALAVLSELAPQLDTGFSTLFLSDYVALYGGDHFDVSMDALEQFTCIGSAEFAIRHFLKRDFERTLDVMHNWTNHANPHVRRLATEGSRPLLPWAFRVKELSTSPPVTGEILNRLKNDDSKYVRLSVANHLNDITKIDPDWVIDSFQTWDFGNAETLRIAKHGLRTLVKRGDHRALFLLGAGESPKLAVEDFAIAPQVVSIGGAVAFSCKIRSTSPSDQRLIIDFVVHYARKSGTTFAKTFKLKTVNLKAGEVRPIHQSIQLRDLSTRSHYAGLHRITVVANGVQIAEGTFDLLPQDR